MVESSPKRLTKSKALSKIIFANSVVNISPSLYLYECFKDKKYKCEYIPNFIDIEKYTFRNMKEAQPNLLWVRSLHKIYNPTMAIKVLSVIIKKYPHAKLCMVGPDKDGSMKKCKNLSKN